MTSSVRSVPRSSRREGSAADLEAGDLDESSSTTSCDTMNGRPGISSARRHRRRQSKSLREKGPQVETVKELYDQFLRRFRDKLEYLRKARPKNEKLYKSCQPRYAPLLTGRSQAKDPLLKVEGHITYFLPGAVRYLDNAFSIKSMTETNTAYAEMDAYWSEHCRDRAKGEMPPLYQWVHIPANNMIWVRQVLTQILKHYYGGKEDYVSRILQHEYWEDQEDHLANPRFGRSMKPFGLVIREQPGSGQVLKDPVSLAVYLPYLHWERAVAVAYMNHVASDIKENQRSYEEFAEGTNRTLENYFEHLAAPSAPTDEMLLRKYLRGNSDIHMRRTLDQYYHTDLLDTSDRDRDQTISRYAERHYLWPREGSDREPPVLMVDQCWMWIIGVGERATILTSFPTSWSFFDTEGLSDPLDVRRKITRNLNRRSFRRKMSTPSTLAAFILEQCVRNIMETSTIMKKRYRFVDQYELSINSLVGRQAEAFKKLWKGVRQESKGTGDDVFDAFDEFRMYQEAKDIEEELQMILKVRDHQVKCLTWLTRDSAFKSNALGSEYPNFTGSFLPDRHKARTRHLEHLLSRAEGVQEDIRQFLKLKQQRASISEARSLRRLAQASERQSDTTFVFTVISIIFLPLTTLASFFGMNAVELGSGVQPIGIIFAYIFPISVLIIAVAMFAGFDHSARRHLESFLRARFPKFGLREDRKRTNSPQGEEPNQIIEDQVYDADETTPLDIYSSDSSDEDHTADYLMRPDRNYSDDDFGEPS